jgi:hypothetical protein
MLRVKWKRRNQAICTDDVTYFHVYTCLPATRSMWGWSIVHVWLIPTDCTSAAVETFMSHWLMLSLPSTGLFTRIPWALIRQVDKALSW